MQLRNGVLINSDSTSESNLVPIKFHIHNKFYFMDKYNAISKFCATTKFCRYNAANSSAISSKQEPEVRFQQMEAVFTLNTLNKVIEDVTKFANLQANLNRETHSQVLQILNKLPEDNKYAKAKQEII